MYLVVRADLRPGLQAAQLCHALRAFVDEHRGVEEAWFTESNTLVCLRVQNVDALEQLAADAEDHRVEVSRFHEPDLDGSLTAVAIGPRGRNLCRGLPLALS